MRASNKQHLMRLIRSGPLTEQKVLREKEEVTCYLRVSDGFESYLIANHRRPVFHGCGSFLVRYRMVS